MFLFLGCLLTAFLFCLVFSITTSPLYGYEGCDSAIFRVVGKYWAQGFMPYTELWDHKGPIIFLMDCLGYMLTGSKLGIMIIQSLSLSVFIYFVYRIFERKFTAWPSAAFTALTLLWLGCVYNGGNLTEEYLLPLLAASVLNTLKWLDKEEISPTPHNRWYAFLHGAILAFALLTRLTNAALSCAIMLAVGLILIRDRQWSNLWHNILFYVLGFAALTLPFVLWFAANGALDEAVFATFTYNISYAQSFAGEGSYSISKLVHLVISALNCTALTAVSAYMFFSNKGHRHSAFVWLLASGILCASWFATSLTGTNYRMPSVAVFPVLILELYCLKRGFHPILRYVAIAGLALLPLWKVSTYLGGEFHYEFMKWDSSALAAKVREDIPEEGLKRFIGYDVPPDIYFHLDARPCYRYYNMQSWQGKRSGRLKEDIMKAFGTAEAEWVLLGLPPAIMPEILNQAYIPVRKYTRSLSFLKKDQEFILYKRMEN